MRHAGLDGRARSPCDHSCTVDLDGLGHIAVPVSPMVYVAGKSPDRLGRQPGTGMRRGYSQREWPGTGGITTARVMRQARVADHGGASRDGPEGGGVPHAPSWSRTLSKFAGAVGSGVIDAGGGRGGAPPALLTPYTIRPHARPHPVTTGEIGSVAALGCSAPTPDPTRRHASRPLHPVTTSATHGSGSGRHPWPARAGAARRRPVDSDRPWHPPSRAVGRRIMALHPGRRAGSW